MSRIVITGAPGAGKTTLLLALQARGYTIVGDTARTIIQDRRRRGLSPRPDPYAFAQEALRMDIENFVRHAATPGAVFFERGVLDALCGLDQITPLNESELRMCPTRRSFIAGGGPRDATHTRFRIAIRGRTPSAPHRLLRQLPQLRLLRECVPVFRSARLERSTEPDGSRKASVEGAAAAFDVGLAVGARMIAPSDRGWFQTQ